MAAPTATVLLWLAVPVGPVQVTVYVVDEVRPGVVKLPVVPVPPPPVEEHEVALLEVHSILEVPPLTTVDGVAVMLTPGREGVGEGGGALESAVSTPPAPHDASAQTATVAISNWKRNFVGVSVQCFDMVTPPQTA